MKFYRLKDNCMIIFTHDGQLSSKYFKQNKSYTTFMEVTPHFLTVQRRNATKSNKNVILLSLISNNCCKMNLVVLHNLCSMCPPPVPTLLLSLFVKFLMDLLINLTDSLLFLIYQFDVILLSDFSVTCGYTGTLFLFKIIITIIIWQYQGYLITII